LPYDEFLALSHVFVENSERIKHTDGFEPLEEMMQKTGMQNLEVGSLGLSSGTVSCSGMDQDCSGQLNLPVSVLSAGAFTGI
jgi:hypothetical protein